MNGTTPTAKIAAKINNDAPSRSRLDAQKRAMDDALAGHALRDRVRHAGGGTPMVPDLGEAADAVANRSDEPYPPTLQRSIAEMGGHLVVQAVFPNVRVNLLRRRNDFHLSPGVDPAERFATAKERAPLSVDRARERGQGEGNLAALGSSSGFLWRPQSAGDETGT